MIDKILKQIYYFFKRLLENSISDTNKNSPILYSGEVRQIIDDAYERETTIVLPDSSYKTVNIKAMEKIFKDYWIPYKERKNLNYQSKYDCDNYALSFANLVQEMKLGLAIGFCHYHWEENEKWYGHAVSCFISDDKKFFLVEPQSDFSKIYSLEEGKHLDFVYMEGIL